MGESLSLKLPLQGSLLWAQKHLATRKTDTRKRGNRICVRTNLPKPRGSGSGYPPIRGGSPPTGRTRAEVLTSTSFLHPRFFLQTTSNIVSTSGSICRSHRTSLKPTRMEAARFDRVSHFTTTFQVTGCTSAQSEVSPLRLNPETI
jgi:hypothetical protein